MTDSTPPGWYYAEGDPPGTQRYWDGLTWQGDPQPVPATQDGVGAQGFAVTRNGGYAQDSQAVLALILSILGLITCCGLTCPIGWYLGQKEITAIDAGLRQPSNRGTANAGKIVGIVGTALYGLALLAYIIIIVAVTAV